MYMYHTPLTNIFQEEYLSAMSQGNWNRRVELAGGEVVILHSPSTIVQYPASQFRPIDPLNDLSIRGNLVCWTGLYCSIGGDQNAEETGKHPHG